SASEWLSLKELDPNSCFFDFVNQKVSQETIDHIYLIDRLKSVNIPALFVGGWFDALLKHTMNAYKNYGGPSMLWIGPWTHSEMTGRAGERSEEHTSELQSRFDLVCRLLLDKTKTI